MRLTSNLISALALLALAGCGMISSNQLTEAQTNDPSTKGSAPFTGVPPTTPPLSTLADIFAKPSPTSTVQFK